MDIDWLIGTLEMMFDQFLDSVFLMIRFWFAIVTNTS